MYGLHISHIYVKHTQLNDYASSDDAETIIMTMMTMIIIT